MSLNIPKFGTTLYLKPDKENEIHEALSELNVTFNRGVNSFTNYGLNDKNEKVLFNDYLLYSLDDNKPVIYTTRCGEWFDPILTTLSD